MNDITILVDQAMALWQEETDCGATDPAFGGEIGEDIDKLVDGLSVFDVKTLLKTEKPIVFVEGTGEPTDGCFTLICNRCGRSVSITPKNAGNHLREYGYKHILEKGGDLRVESAEDTYDMIIVCPCGNHSYEESQGRDEIKLAHESYGPPFIDDDDPNVPD